MSVMVLFRTALSVVLLVCGQSFGSPVRRDTCYSTASSPYRHYSTHTDYNDVRGHGEDFGLPGCQPRKFYMLSRHGIRYPTDGSYDFEKRHLPRLHTLAVDSMHKGSLCKADQDAIRHWEYRFHSHDAGALAASGKQEAYELGKRYEKRFPNLVGRSYSRDRYDFQHTYIQRTEDTARAIANAFFNQSNIHMSVASHCDSKLLFYGCCQKFRTTVHDKPLVDHVDFRDSHEMLGVISAVTSRLGLQHGTVSFHDVEAMYDACAFEHGVYRSSPWCAVFSDDDIKVMEYYEDLRYYWEFGYGHSINYEQTCDLVKDLIGYLRGSSSVTGMIRVAHDLTMMPFLSRLGAYQDSSPPRSTTMARQSHRNFRSSIMAPFLSNVVFVEYQCGSESKVRAFHNEKPLTLPMCPASGCPLSSILNSYLGSAANTCDFQRTCEYSSHHNCDGHVTHSGTCVPTIIG
ncbi:multiple inositol polyphosphate phosphatase 1-like [Liolophura sinensis]|uniref:multiple inositol polyphosphate phosphatase 1-like n=1 Tax=Liolophura sinensis TaxID=3198878 RepID=UPI00315922DA